MPELTSRAAVAFLLATIPLLAQKEPDAPRPLPTIAAKTAAMTNMPGLLPLHWDPLAGKLYLEIPQLKQDLVYTNSLPYGTGSNDLGLDRGQTAEGKIVHFERTGPKVLLIEPNQAFRGSTTDPAEQLAIRQSFPVSVLAGFTIAAADPNGAVLVDATDFFLRDVHGVQETLTRLQQGTYKLDATRSAIDLESTKAFPRNTEVDALLTFTTDAVGGRRGSSFVADVTPDPHALTVHEHQSFLALPGPGFYPRRYDPRAGYFPTSYRDYSSPLGEQLDQQFIIRHRLNKKDPACRSACEAEAPIQYYVDSGAPEPIRAALLEGARWWDDAFQAAGWAKGTFKVDILPAGADPMDVRFNIIQWVHRYTRGWSYGAAVTDPRTGEIIKGNVTLGSLRGRQDYLFAEALLSPYITRARPMAPNADPMLAMVLQRIRQLAAHETGHTLGLAHNFAASAFPHNDVDQTVSVMDYPQPYITLNKQGVPDLSHAYPVGIGIWDKVAIDYGYRQFPARSNDTVELDKILAKSEQSGLLFITDEDARPLGSAHPHAHLWDNGSDPADELTRILSIRQAALNRFGLNAIRPGQPVAQLQDTLVPLYLLHRYQTEAAIKEIGGLDYVYEVRGKLDTPPQIVSPEAQRKALTAVLQTLTPQTLTLPESLLSLLPPRPPALHRNQESIATQTGLTFDPIAAAESAADLTLTVLFNPERASRLVQYHARNPAGPSLEDVINATLEATWKAPRATGLASIVQQAIESRTIEALLSLAGNPAASMQAREIVRYQVSLFNQSLPSSTDPTSVAHRAMAVARIDEYLKDPAKFVPAKLIEAPPGMPIGDDETQGDYERPSNH